MKLVGYMLLACIVLAALKVAVVVLAIVLAITFVVSLIRRPGEALGFVLLVIAANNPWPFAALVVCAMVARMFMPSGDAASALERDDA